MNKDKCTHICKLCGEEINNGILNIIKHMEICKRNSPNTNISNHRKAEEIKEHMIQSDKDFEITLAKMNKDELLKYLYYRFVEGEKMGKC